MRATLLFPAALCLLASLPFSQARAQATRAPDILTALRLYLENYAPDGLETSLLAYAREEGLDWSGVQNLFEVKVTDPANHYLEWRGHRPTAGGSVFTTLRAASYLQGSKALLVVNREWCQASRCQVRTDFAWVTDSLSPLAEEEVIPLIRDQDFYPGRVPACLKGVTLGVSYVPPRKGLTLSALAVIPPAAQQACADAGTPLGNVTRPLRLNWVASVGKFRKGW